jgi:hypothetical protein
MPQLDKLIISSQLFWTGVVFFGFFCFFLYYIFPLVVFSIRVRSLFFIRFQTLYSILFHKLDGMFLGRRALLTKFSAVLGAVSSSFLKSRASLLSRLLAYYRFMEGFYIIEGRFKAPDRSNLLYDNVLLRYQLGARVELLQLRFRLSFFSSAFFLFLSNIVLMSQILSIKLWFDSESEASLDLAEWLSLLE